MPGWTEECPQHLNFVLLSVDGFETPITDCSLSSKERRTKECSTSLLSQLILLLLKYVHLQTIQAGTYGCIQIIISQCKGLH